MSRAVSIAAEVVQFVPILTLASSFIVAGEVDLGRASTLFVVAATLALVITVGVLFVRAPLNTILLGTNLWLALGAVAFGVPLTPLAEVLGRVQGVALFACVLSVGLVLTVAAPRGFVGVVLPDARRRRLGSGVLLGLTLLALVWSMLFMDNIRLGGGLPFILLNISRRVLGRRLSRPSPNRPPRAV